MTNIYIYIYIISYNHIDWLKAVASIQFLIHSGTGDRCQNMHGMFSYYFCRALAIFLEAIAREASKKVRQITYSPSKNQVEVMTWPGGGYPGSSP